jgi:nitrogen fixation protein
MKVDIRVTGYGIGALIVKRDLQVRDNPFPILQMKTTVGVG